MEPPRADQGPPLAYLLLKAGRMLDAALRAELEVRGWPRLSAAQSLVFALLDPGGMSPAALARRQGITRQAGQDLVAGLVAHGLLEVVPDPARRGGRVVCLTEAGRALAADASVVLSGLEAQLGASGDRLRSELMTLSSLTLTGTRSLTT